MQLQALEASMEARGKGGLEKQWALVPAALAAAVREPSAWPAEAELSAAAA